MGPLSLSLTYITASDALTETDLLKLMTQTPWLKWADWNWLAETKLTETVWLTLTNQGGPLEPLILFFLFLWFLETVSVSAALIDLEHVVQKGCGGISLILMLTFERSIKTSAVCMLTMPCLNSGQVLDSQ